MASNIFLDTSNQPEPANPEVAEESGTHPVAVNASSRVANFADFQGSDGRRVYFRPDRYLRADLGPVGVVVELSLGEERHRCELFDVSQSGVAFDWPSTIPVESGLMLPEILVKFDDHEAYRGEARVSSIRRDGTRTIVGVSLTDTLMNIEDVLHLRDVKAWASGGESRGLGSREAPWNVLGHERFKALVAELRLNLEDTQARFAELEASLPWHVAHGDQDSPAREALIERVRSEFVASVVRVLNEIDMTFRLASRKETEALREFSGRFLHDFFMQSPVMHRSRHKPLGYPGDFEVMRGIYGDHFAGATLFAKALNLVFVSTPAAVAVRGRKDMIKHRLSELLDAPGAGNPLRILSIAAGPAQEVFELLEERHDVPRPLEIVLFDQDKRALSFSSGRLRRAAARFGDRVKLLHLHDSIKHLLRGAAVFDGHGTFDAVYSSGLFDYLQRPTAVSLCRSLYSLVAPGGTLYIGNMAPSCPTRWVMELHLDWYLVYRERSELLDIARQAAPGAHLEILEEVMRVNPFVALTKE